MSMNVNRADKIADFWRIAEDRRVTLDEPRLIGIINPTPDSFSNSGMYFFKAGQGGATAVFKATLVK